MNVIQLPRGVGAVQPPSAIKGRNIAKQKLSKLELALLAGDVRAGRVPLGDFSLRQLSNIFGVSIPSISAAAKLTEEDYSELRRGLRPLILREPKEPTAPAMPLSPQERLAQVVAEIGFDATLTMLAASEQQSAAAA
jgi:hypothetical protein